MDRSKLLAIRGTLHARQREWQYAEIDFRSALSLVDGRTAMDPGYVAWLLTSLADALMKTHRRQEGRRMQARAAALRNATAATMIVDMSDFAVHPKPANK
jgi:hypothetical protein